MATKPRLRDKMREDLALRAMSADTTATYIRCARQFSEHLGRSPCAMGPREIRAFLLHVIQERKVCEASFNVYARAIKFLYAVTLRRPEAVADASARKIVITARPPGRTVLAAPALVAASTEHT